MKTTDILVKGYGKVYLHPFGVIADSKEHYFVLLIIVPLPIDCKGSIKEGAVHQGSPGHDLVVVRIVRPPAVDPHKYHGPGLPSPDALLEVLHLGQQVVMEGEVSSQLGQYVFEQPQKMWIQS